MTVLTCQQIVSHVDDGDVTCGAPAAVRLHDRNGAPWKLLCEFHYDQVRQIVSMAANLGMPSIEDMRKKQQESR